MQEGLTLLPAATWSMAHLTEITASQNYSSGWKIMRYENRHYMQLFLLDSLWMCVHLPPCACIIPVRLCTHVAGLQSVCMQCVCVLCIWTFGLRHVKWLNVYLCQCFLLVKPILPISEWVWSFFHVVPLSKKPQSACIFPCTLQTSHSKRCNSGSLCVCVCCERYCTVCVYVCTVPWICTADLIALFKYTNWVTYFKSTNYIKWPLG